MVLSNPFILRTSRRRFLHPDCSRVFDFFVFRKRIFGKVQTTQIFISFIHSFIFFKFCFSFSDSNSTNRNVVSVSVECLWATKLEPNRTNRANRRNLSSGDFCVSIVFLYCSEQSKWNEWIHYLRILRAIYRIVVVSSFILESRTFEAVQDWLPVWKGGSRS